MTDGISTQDRNPILNTAIRNGGTIRRSPQERRTTRLKAIGAHFFNNVVKYYTTTTFYDLNQTKRVTYTIGFELDSIEVIMLSMPKTSFGQQPLSAMESFIQHEAPET